MISYLKREVYRWLIKGILKKMEKFMGLIFIIVKKGMVSKRFEAGIIWLVVGMMLLAVFLYALFPENLSITGKAGSDFSDVTFGTVNVDYVSNIAPRLGDIEDSILICEDSFLNYSFDASDVEENQIITVDINPKGLFYVNPITFINDKQTFAESYIISKDFVKVDVGSRIYTLSVSDQKYVDTKIVNITIVEVNNPPVVSEIGAQTVWINGSNTTFYKEIDVNDVESGDRTSGDLTFDLTFLDGDQFFDITNDGVMSFVADESLIGFYNISVCVSDVGLDVTSANIDLCGQDGLSQTVCKNFSLAVTLNNRAPTIVSHYPDSVGSFAGTTGLYLNTTYMDPDGNIPDARWYIDGALKQLETGSLNSEFSYIFGCDVSGIHTAELIVGDGNLNDSVFWSFEVAKIDCPESMILAGSEKKSIGARCVVDWICNDWNVCQNIQTSLDLNIISSIDYRKSIDACKKEFQTNFNRVILLRVLVVLMVLRIVMVVNVSCWLIVEVLVMLVLLVLMMLRTRVKKV
jgi:hypothetical protein